MSLITTTANGGNHGTKVDLQAQYQSVISGLLTYYQPTDQFQMASGTFSRDELVSEFQAFVSAAQQTNSSNQQWRANVQSERAMATQVGTLRQGVKGIVQARFGASGAQNLQFGFVLPKPRKKSAEVKAVAVQKGLATRKERGTRGSVQKKDIKGNVNVALVVTPGDSAGTAATASASQVVATAAVATAQPQSAGAAGVSPSSGK